MILELYQALVSLLQALVKKDAIRRQVLRVKGCLAGSKAENLLEQGDMLLAISKAPVTCFRDIENACQELDRCNDSNGELKMTIFRQVFLWRNIYIYKIWFCFIYNFHITTKTIVGLI